MGLPNGVAFRVGSQSAEVSHIARAVLSSPGNAINIENIYGCSTGKAKLMRRRLFLFPSQTLLGGCLVRLIGKRLLWYVCFEGICQSEMHSKEISA